MNAEQNSTENCVFTLPYGFFLLLAQLFMPYFWIQPATSMPPTYETH